MKASQIFGRFIRFCLPLNFRIKIIWKTKIIFKILFGGFHVLRTEKELEMSVQFCDYIMSLDQQSLNKKITDLKLGLDINSQKTVDNFINNKKYILNHNLISLDNLFSKDEIKEQKECSNEFKKLETLPYVSMGRNPESIFGISGFRWLPPEARSRLENSIILDVGAYDGDSAFSFYRFLNPKKIYAIEPEKNNFNRLIKNIKVFDKKNIVVPLMTGLSDFIGRADITNDDSGSKIVLNRDGVVDINTIDNLVDSLNIKQVDVIKMDIEGGEMRALLGAINVIKHYHPVLSISIYHSGKDFFEIKPWLASIYPGYKFFIKKIHPFVLDREVVLLAY